MVLEYRAHPASYHRSSPNQRAQTWWAPPMRDPPGSRRAKLPMGEGRSRGPGEHKWWAWPQLTSEVEITVQNAPYLRVGIMEWAEGCESTRSLELARYLMGSWILTHCIQIMPPAWVFLGPLLAEYSMHQENQKKLIRKCSKNTKQSQASTRSLISLS